MRRIALVGLTVALLGLDAAALAPVSNGEAVVAVIRASDGFAYAFSGQLLNGEGVFELSNSFVFLGGGSEGSYWGYYPWCCDLPWFVMSRTSIAPPGPARDFAAAIHVCGGFACYWSGTAEGTIVAR